MCFKRDEEKKLEFKKKAFRSIGTVISVQKINTEEKNTNIFAEYPTDTNFISFSRSPTICISNNVGSVFSPF